MTSFLPSFFAFSIASRYSSLTSPSFLTRCMSVDVCCRDAFVFAPHSHAPLLNRTNPNARLKMTFILQPSFYEPLSDKPQRSTAQKMNLCAIVVLRRTDQPKQILTPVYHPL